MTTPAEELREAAQRIRFDAAWPAEDLYHALAEWLEVKAANSSDHDHGYALAVARAYPGKRIHIDRPAVERNEDAGIEGDPDAEVIYDRDGNGWHVAADSSESTEGERSHAD